MDENNMLCLYLKGKVDLKPMGHVKNNEANQNHYLSQDFFNREKNLII